jgi:hypothetical protein
MANAIYDKYKEALMSGDTNVSLLDGNVKISLIDADATPYSVTQQYYSELVAGEVAVANLDNVAVTNGVLSGDNIIYYSIPANTALDAESLVVWIDTANNETSRLVAWMDTNIQGLPISPDGGDIDIIWSSSGIFKL